MASRPPRGYDACSNVMTTQKSNFPEAKETSEEKNACESHSSERKKERGRERKGEKEREKEGEKKRERNRKRINSHVRG